MANKVESTITDLITPIIEKRNDLLWSVSFKKEGTDFVLRILVDKKDYEIISMQEIIDLTDEINELLDTVEPDPIPYAYMLDISSPGADRPLEEKWHYEWVKNADELIEVRLFKAVDNLAKQFVAEIVSITDDGLNLLIDNQEIFVAFDNIAKAVLHIDFDN